jgi:hypothetical protein
VIMVIVSKEEGRAWSDVVIAIFQASTPVSEGTDKNHKATKCQPLISLMYQPLLMRIEQLVVWELAREMEVLGAYLP